MYDVDFGGQRPTGRVALSSLPYRATPSEQRLFLQLRNVLSANAPDFIFAGSVLDRVWAYTAIKKREEAKHRKSLSTGPHETVHKQYEDLINDSIRKELNLPSSVEIKTVANAQIRAENETFFCLSKFLQHYRTQAMRTQNPFDLSIMSAKRADLHSRMILIVAWLCTDADAHTRKLCLTGFESTPFRYEGLGRFWARNEALHESQEPRDVWLELVESSLNHVLMTQPELKNSTLIPAGYERSKGVQVNRINRRLAPEAAKKVCGVLEFLNDHLNEWIARTELSKGGLPATSVDAEWRKECKETDKKGGQADGGAVFYRTEFVIEFVVATYCPKAPRASANRAQS